MNVKITFPGGGFLFLLAFLLNSSVNSANILVIAFFSSPSHRITYMPLVEELGKRGHHLHVVTPIKPSKEMTNVTEIYTLDVEEIKQRNHFDMFDMKEKGSSASPSMWMAVFSQICNDTYDLPQVRSLLNEKFDLVILQPLFNECVLGLIYRLQVPFVLFTPLYAPQWIISKVGGDLPPSFNPNLIIPYPQEMNFFQRFLNYGAQRMMDLWNAYWYEPMAERIYREKLGNDIPSVNEIMANASLVLSNSHFSLSGHRPYLPDVVDVGGMHSQQIQPIPKELEDFIGKGKEGFILFSMGSVIKGDMMPEGKRKMILNVFSKLEQQVLWKWESESMPDLPKNVKLSKWLPQQDLLAREDIRMFITHCGGGSTEEAIYHGVPLVGLPMLGDQFQNADLAKKHDFIVELEWNDLTEEGFDGAIRDILKNPKYRENVGKLSTLFRDRPMDPLEQGVYWIEYVLRHKGAAHLRSAGRKLNAFQYHSYDVILAYLAIVGAVFYVIYKTLRLICRKLIGKSASNIKMSVANGKKVN